MTPAVENRNTAIDEAAGLLLARAVNPRGLTAADDVAPRIRPALEKYLFRNEPNARRPQIIAFCESLHADDLCLVIACEKSDEAAWSDLVATFDATVKSAARKISRNAEDADDLASLIWAELHGMRGVGSKGKISYYSGVGRLGGWLRAVVAQVAVDEHRKRSRYVSLDDDRELDDLVDEARRNGGSSGISGSGATESPEALLTEQRASADVSAALAAAIAALDADDRLILKLYYFDNVKLKAIADTFGYHEATASRKLARLHTAIRKSVEKTLMRQNGWNQTEVGGYLSETAVKLGANIEKLFAVLILAAILQEMR